MVSIEYIRRTNIEASIDGGNAANEHDVSTATGSSKPAVVLAPDGTAASPSSSSSAAAAAAGMSESNKYGINATMDRSTSASSATADRDQMVLSELGDFGTFGGDLLASAAVGGAEETNLPPRGAMAPQPDEVDDDEDMPPLPPPLPQVEVAANGIFPEPKDLAGARLSSLKNDASSAIDAAVDAAVGESSPGRWERAWDSFCYHNNSGEGNSPPDQAPQAKPLVPRGGDLPAAAVASTTAAASGSEMKAAADIEAAVDEAELRAFLEVRVEANRTALEASTNAADASGRPGAGTGGRKSQAGGDRKVQAGTRDTSPTKPKRPVNGYNLFVMRHGSKAKERDRVWKVYNRAIYGSKKANKLARIATHDVISNLWGNDSDMREKFAREAKEQQESYRAQTEPWRAAEDFISSENSLLKRHSQNRPVELSIPLVASPTKPRRPATGYNLFLKQHGSKAKERDRVWGVYSRAVNGNKNPKKLPRIATTGDIAGLWGANSEMREISEREATEQQESYRAKKKTWRAAERFQGCLSIFPTRPDRDQMLLSQLGDFGIFGGNLLASVAVGGADEKNLPPRDPMPLQPGVGPLNDAGSSKTAAASMTAADTTSGNGNCASSTVVPANVGVGAPAVPSLLLRQQPPSQPQPQLMTTPATLEEMYRLQVERQRLPAVNPAAVPQLFLPQRNVGPALALQQAQVPGGWKMEWDPVWTRSYFYSTITGEVTWDPPPVLHVPHLPPLPPPPPRLLLNHRTTGDVTWGSPPPATHPLVGHTTTGNSPPDKAIAPFRQLVRPASFLEMVEMGYLEKMTPEEGQKYLQYLANMTSEEMRHLAKMTPGEGKEYLRGTISRRIDKVTETSAKKTKKLPRQQARPASRSNSNSTNAPVIIDETESLAEAPAAAPAPVPDSATNAKTLNGAPIGVADETKLMANDPAPSPAPSSAPAPAPAPAPSPAPSPEAAANANAANGDPPGLIDLVTAQDPDSAPVAATNVSTGNKSEPITDGKGVPITAVGYSFEKHFNGHGWFKGKVVQIRPGAAGGKNRRCEYEDGDKEDLSLRQLRNLHYEAQKKETKKTKKKNQQGKAAKLLTSAPAPDVGEGWTMKTYQRQTGSSAGHTDSYWYSPELEKKFRSLKEIGRFKQALAQVLADAEDTLDAADAERLAWSAFK